MINMYNTIEVSVLDIHKIDLKFCKKGNFLFKTEGLKNIKVLPWLSVAQAVKGSYEIALGNGRTHSTGAGGMFIAPSNIQQTIIHHTDPNEQQVFCRWVFIDAVINDIYRFDFLYDFPLIVPEPARQQINEQFDRLFATDDPFESYSCYYAIVAILSRLAVPKEDSIHRRIQSTLAYIRQHYAEEIRIADLAKNVHVSESHFYAVFKKYCGSSPIAYINNYRLSLAAEHLINSDDTISEISDRNGFSDALYFSRMFRKNYGMSPREYRSAYRK